VNEAQPEEGRLRVFEWRSRAAFGLFLVILLFMGGCGLATGFKTENRKTSDQIRSAFHAHQAPVSSVSCGGHHVVNKVDHFNCTVVLTDGTTVPFAVVVSPDDTFVATATSGPVHSVSGNLSQPELQS
jgi:hypothetical protein